MDIVIHRTICWDVDIIDEYLERVEEDKKYFNIYTIGECKREKYYRYELKENCSIYDLSEDIVTQSLWKYVNDAVDRNIYLKCFRKEKDLYQETKRLNRERERLHQENKALKELMFQMTVVMTEQKRIIEE
jgi:hypothetical protein